MTDTLRSLLAALAILATVLTAGAVGAARGQAAVAGEIVICAGGHAVTVPVDADGNPTGPPHWCPDCALGLLAGLAAAPASPQPPVAAQAAPGGAAFASLSGRRAPVPPARGPPPV